MRFICDVMLGRLAKYLRILGFDAEYARNEAALKRYGQEADDRIFLTRRAKRTRFTKTVRIRSEQTREQLREIKELIRSDLRYRARIQQVYRMQHGIGRGGQDGDRVSGA